MKRNGSPAPVLKAEGPTSASSIATTLPPRLSTPKAGTSATVGTAKTVTAKTVNRPKRDLLHRSFAVTRFASLTVFLVLTAATLDGALMLGWAEYDPESFRQMVQTVVATFDPHLEPLPAQ